jgi:hypothetical protein
MLVFRSPPSNAGLIRPLALYQPRLTTTLPALVAAGIARRVGGRASTRGRGRRAERGSYRPKLTHSSWSASRAVGISPVVDVAFLSVFCCSRGCEPRQVFNRMSARLHAGFSNSVLCGQERRPRRPSSCAATAVGRIPVRQAASSVGALWTASRHPGCLFNPAPKWSLFRSLRFGAKQRSCHRDQRAQS